MNKETNILKIFSKAKAKRYAQYLRSFQDKSGAAFYMCFDDYQLKKNNANPMLIFLHFWKKYLKGTDFGLAKAGVGGNQEHPSYMRETVMFWLSGLEKAKLRKMKNLFYNTSEGLFPCQKYFGNMCLDLSEFYEKEIDLFSEFEAETYKASLPTCFLWNNKDIYEHDPRFLFITGLFYDTER